jgi:hypothetical protein
MRSPKSRVRASSAICAALVVVLLRFTASAETDRQPPETRLLQHDKAVLLQIRISEAKRKPDSVRYYKSAARCRKKGRAILPFSYRAARGGTGRRPAD